MNSYSTRFGNGKTWFVSRHAGAIEWAKRQELGADRWTAHLDPMDVAAGDTVIGTLPVNLAAVVCRRGARYIHLSLDIPLEWRGRELSMEELSEATAQLREHYVIEAQ